jgi:hypothetical protein
VNCKIYGNKTGHGIKITEDGKLTISNCQINQNEGVAISVSENGSASVTNCDLTGNSD